MQPLHRNLQKPLPNTTACTEIAPNNEESDDIDDVVERSIDKGQIRIPEIREQDTRTKN